MTLLLLPAAGLAPPYQFTENVTGLGHWLIPAVILVTGTIIHENLPEAASSSGLVLRICRSGADSKLFFGMPLAVPFLPMTSAGFILFSLTYS